MILDRIKEANDIKKIEPENYQRLAKEIRHFLVENVSQTGGHLASNLGVVELTMALHLFLDFPEDALVWDVGHQSYVHKMLTGRKQEFASLREYGGMSGFPKKRESGADAFHAGHSSTSISAALGIAKARDLQEKEQKVVAVIGDGALSGGMAYEALNNAARIKTNLIIILNDNNMSISENVGGMANYLGKVRTNGKYQDLKNDVENVMLKVPKVGESLVEKIRRSKDSIKRLVIPGMLFEDMGLTYIGLVDGHNIELIVSALNIAKKVKGPVLIHVITKKGKGYPPAERYPSAFHGVDPFDIKTGKPLNKKTGKSYTSVFSESLLQLAKENEKVVAVTAAMPSGTGLLPFKEHFPERFFDVGIAEEHAVTFAAGMASAGLVPVVAVYSTFLQRAYDQILHDVCIDNLPVVFAVDRAGLVGKDGETHQGIFDLSFLSTIPNLTIMAPKNAAELKEMLAFAVELKKPIAIRYPRGNAYTGLEEYQEPITYGKSEVIYEGEEIALLAVGSMVKTAEKVRELLREQGRNATLINVRFVKPMDYQMLDKVSQSYKTIVTLEENVQNGGFGEQVAEYLSQKQSRAKQIHISLGDQFVEHGSVEVLYEKLGLDAVSIVERIMS